MDNIIPAALMFIVGIIVAYLIWLFMAMKDKIRVLETENQSLATMIIEHIMSAKDDPGEQTQ